MKFPAIPSVNALHGICAALVVLTGLVIVMSGNALTAPNTATPTNEFLDSIGVNTSFPDRGQPLDKTIRMINYGGFRWVRAGIEGVTEDGPTTMQTFLTLHRETGVKFSWGLLSGSSNLDKLIDTARVLAKADALIALEGNNEPNNWGVLYKGEKGGRDLSWMAVAKLQRDLYQRVKSDPVLKGYPVWSISEPGGQKDNVGLQFLKIPSGADTLMPEGTQYADHANVHNYIYHPNSSELEDNKTWNAADPTAHSKVDGLFWNYGITWWKRFQGYSQDELDSLPRVTTETGATVNEKVDERLQGLHLMNLYLAQFKRGYSHTAVYILRDRTDEGGNQRYGFFTPDFKARKAAIFLHNLTTILADEGTLNTPGQLDFEISPQPETVHDLLLQRSDGAFQLVLWGERLKGEDKLAVRFGETLPNVAIYDPTLGTEPQKTIVDVDEIELTLSDHPLIIEIQSAN